MTLQDILRVKGSAVHSIDPDATIDDVIRTLVARNCGSLVVCEEHSLVGIITERDILKVCAEHGGQFKQIRVRDVMTHEPETASPQDSVEDTMGLMTDRRIRHLPIIEDGRLVGLISIGDVVKAQHDSLSLENHYLKTYIQS
ncbi:MAG TPA: CBS domain-containing protein [Pirellulales bacterium]|nr:CBS domain-containing protein [Pirellulales bacterium]